MTKKQVMRPYNVHLPEDVIVRLRELAKDRKASGLIRDAVIAALEGNGDYDSGYNKGLRDAAKIIKECSEIDIIAIRGVALSKLLSERVLQMLLYNNGK